MDGDEPSEKAFHHTSDEYRECSSICCKIILAEEDKGVVKSRPISRLELTTTTRALSKQVCL